MAKRQARRAVPASYAMPAKGLDDKHFAAPSLARVSDRRLLASSARRLNVFVAGIEALAFPFVPIGFGIPASFKLVFV
jgi:hypothetical protein